MTLVTSLAMPLPSPFFDSSRATPASRRVRPVLPELDDPPTPQFTVNTDRIRTRAYEIYEARKHSGVQGDALSDWLQAERELCDGIVEPSLASDLEMKARARGEQLLSERD